MGRTPSRVQQSIVLLVLAAACSGCGGGGGSGGFVQPPPTPDFLLGFSPGSVSVSQGASSSAVNVMVTAENGFSGSVQVTLTGMPAGVTSNPASPFTVAAGAQTAVVFGAAASAAAGNDSISAIGSS